MHLSLLPGPRPTARFVRKSPAKPAGPPARALAADASPASDEENQTPAVNAVEPVPFDPDPVKEAGGDEGAEGAGDTRRATEGDDVTHQTEPDAGVDAAEDAVADEATDGASRDDDRGSARSGSENASPADDPDGDAAEGSRVRSSASSSSSSSSSTLDEARGQTSSPPRGAPSSDSLAGVPPALEPKVQAPFAARRGDVPREVAVERAKRRYASDFARLDALWRESAHTDAAHTDADTSELLPLSLFDDKTLEPRDPRRVWLDPRALLVGVRCRVASSFVTGSGTGTNLAWLAGTLQGGRVSDTNGDDRYDVRLDRDGATLRDVPRVDCLLYTSPSPRDRG